MNGSAHKMITEDESLDFSSMSTSTSKGDGRPGKLPLTKITGGARLRAAVSYFATTFKIYCTPLVDDDSRIGIYHGHHPCFTPESFAFVQNDPELMNNLNLIMSDTDNESPAPDGEKDPMARVRAAVHHDRVHERRETLIVL